MKRNYNGFCENFLHGESCTNVQYSYWFGPDDTSGPGHEILDSDYGDHVEQEMKALVDICHCISC